MQNAEDEQDTAVGVVVLSKDAGADQFVPFHLTSFPESSIAMQKEEVGQDTLSKSFDESTSEGAVQLVPL
jgi:hypothetical protein